MKNKSRIYRALQSRIEFDVFKIGGAYLVPVTPVTTSQGQRVVPLPRGGSVPVIDLENDFRRQHDELVEKPKRKGEMSDERLLEIHQAAKDGKSIAGLARDFGISYVLALQIAHGTHRRTDALLWAQSQEIRAAEERRRSEQSTKFRDSVPAEGRQASEPRVYGVRVQRCSNGGYEDAIGTIGLKAVMNEQGGWSLKDGRELTWGDFFVLGSPPDMNGGVPDPRSAETADWVRKSRAAALARLDLGQQGGPV